MQNQNNEFIKLLQNQKNIRILFIFLNVFAWFADNITQNDIINNENKHTKTSQYIYNFILIISILINIYYILIIYEQIKTTKIKNQDTKQLEIKKNALILLVAALIILLYTQSPTFSEVKTKY